MSRPTGRQGDAGAATGLRQMDHRNASLPPKAHLRGLTLANAGLPLSAADTRSPVAWAVFVGFTLGKPIGIVSFGWLAS